MTTDVKQKKQAIQQKIKDARKKQQNKDLLASSSESQNEEMSQESSSINMSNSRKNSILETIKSDLDSKFKLLKIDDSGQNALLFLNSSKEKRFTIGGDYQALVLGEELKINCTTLKANDCIKMILRPLYPKALIDLSKESFSNNDSEDSDGDNDAVDLHNQNLQKDRSLMNLDQFCKANNVSHIDQIQDCFINGGYTHIIFLSILSYDFESTNLYIKNYCDAKQLGSNYEKMFDNKLYIKPRDVQNFDHNWDIKLESDESYKFIESKRQTSSFQEIKNSIERIASNHNKYSSHRNFRTVLVCGEKNLGKTTLCQFMLSTLKQKTGPKDRVFFQETDLGQPIFTLPAFITQVEITEMLQVNSPSTALLKNVIASKYFGDFSPEANFVKYQQSIIQVINKFEAVMKTCGTKNNILVINTHGYVKSFGTMILNDLIKTVSPDQVVNIKKGTAVLEDSDDMSEESLASDNGNQDGYSSITNLLGSGKSLTQISEINQLSGQKTNNIPNNKKWNMLEINAFAKRPFSVNTQVKQTERKNFMRSLFSDEVYSINLNELNFGVLSENFDKVFRDSHVSQKEAVTVALTFINSICWVCLDGEAVSSGQNTLVHIVDFDLNEKLIYVRISITGNLSMQVQDSPTSKKRTFWKSTAIDYPLADEWKENTEKFEIADFQNNSLGKRPFWIYPINGVGSKGSRNKASDRKNQS